MRSMSFVFFICILTVASGCTTLRGVEEKHEAGTPNMKAQFELTSKLKSCADETYIYAQLCSNVYRDGRPIFRSTGFFPLCGPVVDPKSGFYGEVLQDNEGRTVVVFRGTDGWCLRDTLNSGAQKKKAVELVDKIVGQYGPVTATGHSLGGALALKASLLCKDTTAIVFFSSPRIGVSKSEFDEKGVKGNSRVIVEERGEGLRAISRKARDMIDHLKKLEPENEPDLNSFNIMGGGYFSQHSIYDFAIALTHVAAEAGSDSAKHSLKLNSPMYYPYDLPK